MVLPALAGLGAFYMVVFWLIMGCVGGFAAICDAAEKDIKIQLKQSQSNPFYSGVQHWYYNTLKPDLRRNIGKYITISYYANDQFS